jgi:hypothetical protein
LKDEDGAKIFVWLTDGTQKQGEPMLHPRLAALSPDEFIQDLYPIFLHGGRCLHLACQPSRSKIVVAVSHPT